MGQYLLGEPDTAGLRHPLAGVDPGVNPHGRAVRAPCAELGEQRQGVGCVPITTSPSGSQSLNPHLEHVEGTVLGRAADLQLAHQVGVLGHQHVHEIVDLAVRDVGVTPSSQQQIPTPQNAPNLVLSHRVYGVVSIVDEGVGVERQLAAAAEHLPLLFIQQGLRDRGWDEPHSPWVGSPRPLSHHRPAHPRS